MSVEPCGALGKKQNLRMPFLTSVGTASFAIPASEDVAIRKPSRRACTAKERESYSLLLTNKLWGHGPHRLRHTSARALPCAPQCPHGAPCAPASAVASGFCGPRSYGLRPPATAYPIVNTQPFASLVAADRPYLILRRQFLQLRTVATSSVSQSHLGSLQRFLVIHDGVCVKWETRTRQNISTTKRSSKKLSAQPHLRGTNATL